MVVEVGKQIKATIPIRASQTVSKLELLPLIESMLKSQPIVCTAVVTIKFKIEPTVKPAEFSPQEKEEASEPSPTNPQDVIWQF
jgi:hypothetical protein